MARATIWAHLARRTLWALTLVIALAALETAVPSAQQQRSRRPGWS
ncbi:MAG: hypothetical protein R2851_06935 [Caldilineaceae bacterium]